MGEYNTAQLVLCTIILLLIFSLTAHQVYASFFASLAEFMYAVFSKFEGQSVLTAVASKVIKEQGFIVFCEDCDKTAPELIPLNSTTALCTWGIIQEDNREYDIDCEFRILTTLEEHKRAKFIVYVYVCENHIDKDRPKMNNFVFVSPDIGPGMVSMELKDFPKYLAPYFINEPVTMNSINQECLKAYALSLKILD